MSLKPYLSFSSGEIDPVLTDNVTLEKFNKGLATARNVMIGKTGSILSRFSRRHLRNAKVPGKPIKVYRPPNTDFLLEFGDLYCRVILIGDLGSVDIPTSALADLTTIYTETDLPKLHFVTSKGFVYVFCQGKKMSKIRLTNPNGTIAPALIADSEMFRVFNPLASGNIVGNGGGYQVDYMLAVVVNGEESQYIELNAGFGKPIASDQKNTITGVWPTASVTNDVTEMRVYSRPHNGGAYGFLGATTSITTAGADKTGTFIDVGSLPDYGNGTQDLITKFGLGGVAIIDLKPRTGTVYQGRLILTSDIDKEAMIASRPGYQNNFYRDFPYAADSALQFKAGTSGKADVLRLLDSNGLIEFATNGVYINGGLLNVGNTAMDKKGAWIINEKIPPLLVPGGVFFVDINNTIRQLIFSQEIVAYETQEQTIFSNHLFKTRTIESWCYQDGIVPVIIVTFSDGNWATFTYSFEHQMRAWTRHDSKYPIEQVEGDQTIPDTSYFVVNKNGNRSIEISVPRYVAPKKISTNPEALLSHVFMDSYYSYEFLDFDPISFGPYQFVPVTPGNWAGLLTLTYSDVGDSRPVGQVFRWFHPIDKSIIDLVVEVRVSSSTIQVRPSETFPSQYAYKPRLYIPTNSVGNLEHLEGESVVIVSDGSIVCSPNNDVDGYPTFTVTGGQVFLPTDELGAIIHVGRPIVADTKTLNVSTVEQSPTLIESLNVNKLYLKVNDTRGLFINNKFPEEFNDGKDGSSVQGMESLDDTLVPKGDADLIGNRYLPPVSKRIEKTLDGSWDSNGQISIRQVDPYHFEFLSIIPDYEILKRSDR